MAPLTDAARKVTLRLVQLLPLAVLPTLSACDGPTSITEDDFILRATGRDVVLSNHASRPTFYVILEKESATLIDLYICVDERQCRNVAPGASARVPYSAISGYRSGKEEVIVYWWRTVPSPSGPQADSVRRTRMEL